MEVEMWGCGGSLERFGGGSEVRGQRSGGGGVVGAVEGHGDVGWWGGVVTGGRKVEVEMWGCDGSLESLGGGSEVRGQKSEVKGGGVPELWGDGEMESGGGDVGL